MKQTRKNRLKAVVFIIILAAAAIILAEYGLKRIYPIKYRETVWHYSQKYNLDPYLVLAVIRAESSFRPDAVSIKNARGLMQISEKTGSWGAKELGIANYKNELLFIPETNIQIGCWYLSTLYKEFGDTFFVLAAYNGGSGNVNLWLKDGLLNIGDKRPEGIPFKETRIYVERVNRNRGIYKMLYENEF